ncbi:MAG: hypothetical protein WC795_01530 [Candidatus Paceibacterota bacterium]|jgi:type II secretory pathway pseudopilin PulG
MTSYKLQVKNCPPNSRSQASGMGQEARLRRAGFELIEMLIAISIITASVAAIISVAQKSIQVSRQSLHQAQASFLLEEGAESVRTLRDTSWALVLTLIPGITYYPTWVSSWTFLPTPNTVGIFTRTITVQNVNRDISDDITASGGSLDIGTKLITVTVSWQEGGTAMSKSISFYISDIFS